MKTVRVKVIVLLAVLSIAVVLLWVKFKSAAPPKTQFQQSMDTFVKGMNADHAWYREADARGLSPKMYLPRELAATQMTTTEINHVAKRSDWGSLSVAERTRILNGVERKADAARQAMRDSNYTKPFRPDW